MSKGRGSAASVAVRAIALLLVCFIVDLKTAQAETYTVGDDQGWTYDITSWTDGKTFKAGDVLVFNYSKSLHNVVKVSSPANYEGCTAGSGDPTYTSGADQIVLEAGMNYFICTFPMHCVGGMKIAANASA